MCSKCGHEVKAATMDYAVASAVPYNAVSLMADSLRASADEMEAVR
jgi:hypothetical protein